MPVTAIAAGAFGDVTVDALALPPTLKVVEARAFRSLTARDVYLFDTLEDVSDLSFGDVAIRRLHVNAAREPVYCGSYFDTLTDKMDALLLAGDAPKIVLLGGSAIRFAYDSPLLEAAFPQYRVVNMGVYAYSNMLPQARMILPEMRAGDILLSSPEPDAIPAQRYANSEMLVYSVARMDKAALP